jgi:hypothetical protein
LCTGLLASLVLSTFAKLISTLSNTTTPTLPLTLSTAFEAVPVPVLHLVYKILKLKHQHKLFDLNILYHQFEHQKILLMQLIVMMYQMHIYIVTLTPWYNHKVLSIF